jgi:biotin carboxyl carrier protein
MARMKIKVPAGGREHVATVARDGARAWVHVGGHVFVIDPPEQRARAGAASDHDALSAPMPATVIRVDVAPGDAVADGDVVLLLEAMKMELPIRAPRAGVVAAVNCRAGDLVQPGVPLVDLE